MNNLRIRVSVSRHIESSFLIWVQPNLEYSESTSAHLWMTHDRLTHSLTHGIAIYIYITHIYIDYYITQIPVLTPLCSLCAVYDGISAYLIHHSLDMPSYLIAAATQLSLATHTGSELSRLHILGEVV